MAQIIKHRRGSIANVGTLSPVNAGEIVLGTGSIGTLNGPVLFVGDSSSYKAVPQLYYGSSVPSIASYGQLEGVSFYNSTDKNLYILKVAGNTRLDLSGAVSGSAINPLSVTTGVITGSDLYLSGNAVIDGNLTLGGNIAIGNSNTDFVTFGADISSSIIPDSANNFDLGASGKEWRTIYAQQGIFTSASGSFSGSFVGNGAGLTGLVSSLNTSGNTGTGSVSLLTQTLSVVGTTNEVETSVSGQTITIGLPNDVTLGGDLTVGGNDIKSSGGSTAITLSGSDVTIAGDLQVSGNDIKSSTGASVITLSGTDATFNQNITVTGNLTVNGTSTIVNSTTVEIGDNIISLNGSGAANAGLVVRDVTSPTTVSGSLLWDSTNDYWKAGALGSEKRIAVQNAASLTTNALIYGNASSEVVSMTAPSAADQYALWDGTAWTMTNVIDGGTF
jgi:hypothetical protein